MKKQKKWELLKYAYDNYPKGTNFKGYYDKEFISSGSFHFGKDRIDYTAGDGNIIDEASGLVYDAENNKWAEIIQDKPPLFTSEDGVQIYEGDKIFEVRKNSEGFYLVNADSGIGYWICNDNKNVRWLLDEDNEHHSKAFSNKESAEKWIEEQQPKEIILHDEDPYSGAVSVTKERILFYHPKGHDTKIHDGILVTPKELEDIANALKTLSK